MIGKLAFFFSVLKITLDFNILMREADIFLGSCDEVIHLKLYCCSQKDVMENLVCGDVLVAVRVLSKTEMVSTTGRLKSYYYLTTTRETQLYKFNGQLSPSLVKEQPFYKCSLFLKVIEVSAFSSSHFYYDQTVALESHCSENVAQALSSSRSIA